MSGDLAVTWWGHSTATVELAGVRVLTDPLLVGRLAHLRRQAPDPPPSAAEADLVLVSHLHADHLHLPSLARTSRSAPVVLPRGAAGLVGTRGARDLVEVSPGETVEVAGCRVEVLPARHDGHRLPWSRLEAPALGFRVSRGSLCFWFPGDTGPTAGLGDLAPVDLALVPIGGWGPSLGDDHLDPEQAADAVAAVGARAALGVHWGTFWPTGLRRVAPGTHHHLFVTPGDRFADAVAGRADVLHAPHGRRIPL